MRMLQQCLAVKLRNSFVDYETFHQHEKVEEIITEFTLLCECTL